MISSRRRLLLPSTQNPELQINGRTSVDRQTGSMPMRGGLRLRASGLVLAAAFLGVLVALSRLPFRSQYLFAWDSANFALALDQYNVAFHRPQPPGYPLYVASAWLVRHFVPDANAAYVTLSIVASGLAIGFLTLAAAQLFGARTGLFAAVLLATSSIFWSQGEVAYPYAFLACFSSLVAWLCALIQRGGPGTGRLVAGAGAILGIAAGFRSELLPFLAPLWLYAAWQRPASGRSDRLVPIVAGGVAGAAIVVAWYVPMVMLSGGWSAYQGATGNYYAYFIQTTSGAGKLLLGILENSRALVGFLYNGLGLALLPMIYYVGRFFSPQRIVTDRRVQFLVLWIMPPLLFYVTVHIGNPGYILSLVPALCVVASEAILGLLDDIRDALAIASERLRLPDRWLTPVAAAIVLAIGTSNAALFLTASGEGRWREIRQIDRTLGRQVAHIRSSYSPAVSLLVAYDRSRQYQYYLPDYRLDLLFDVAVAGAVTDTSRYWERRTVLTVPEGVAFIVFPDLGRNTSEQPGLVQKVDLGDDVALHVAHVRPGDEVRYGYQYASVRRLQ
jgi:hypothetical protein